MKVETYACDVCGIQKKDANRWWKVAFLAGGADKQKRLGVLITSWNVDPITQLKSPQTFNAPLLNVADVCGEECAMKFISKNLFRSEVSA